MPPADRKPRRRNAGHHVRITERHQRTAGGARARVRALKSRQQRQAQRQAQLNVAKAARTEQQSTPTAAPEVQPAPRQTPSQVRSAPPPPRETELPPSYPPPGKGSVARAWKNVLGGRSVVVVVLCALLGFAVILQVSQQPEESLSRMRQDDLVRLLDELGRRNAELASESNVLQQRLTDLEAGAKDARIAREAAAEQARARSILAGTTPVEGPGITLTIVEGPGEQMTAQMMVTVLEELRNAGAEAIELNNHRISTSTWFRRDGTTLLCDGEELSAPYVFNAIGDAQKLATALDIPGGALATIRNANAKPTVVARDRVTIRAVRTPPELKYAKVEAEK